MECPAKAALCSVTAGGGEIAAVHPKMAWHSAPLPLRRRSAGAATGAVPLGQLFVAAKRSARAQDRRLALIGRHGAQAGSQAARTRSMPGYSSPVPKARRGLPSPEDEVVYRSAEAP